jgi:hypothetical protein
LQDLMTHRKWICIQNFNDKYVFGLLVSQLTLWPMAQQKVGSKSWRPNGVRVDSQLNLPIV